MLAPSVYLRGYESFSEVTGGTALSFRGLSVGETAGPACGTMRRGQDSLADKSLKRPVRLRRASPGALELKKSPHIPLNPVTSYLEGGTHDKI